MGRWSDRPSNRRYAATASVCIALLSLACLTSARAEALPTQPPSGAVAAANAPNIDDLLASLAQPSPAPPRPEPDLFGFTTLRLGESIYDNIWREAAARPWPEGQPELDAFVARIQSLPARQRIAEANAWINARVRFGNDPNLINHHWGCLAEALATGRGEREDIAIAKMQLLAAVGVPRNDLYLVLVSDIQRLRPDALLVVRDGADVYVLDSKQDAFVDDQLAGRYVPIIALGYEGRWIFGHRVGQPMSVAANQRRAGVATGVPAALDVGQASYQSLLPRAR